jgi:hypothetical protein
MLGIAAAQRREGAHRLLTLLAVLLAAGLLAACTDGGQAGELDAEDPAADDEDPSRDEAEADADLAADAEGSADDDGMYLELATAERAAMARWFDLAFSQFGASGEGDLVRWQNEAELWDSFVPAIREDCRAAGPEAETPMWDNDVMIPAGVNPRWNDEATEGRGQFVELVCAYTDGDGQPVERWWGALIRTHEDGTGEVVAQSDPFDVREADYADTVARTDGIRERMWLWISEQPVLE